MNKTSIGLSSDIVEDKSNELFFEKSPELYLNSILRKSNRFNSNSLSRLQKYQVFKSCEIK